MKRIVCMIAALILLFSAVPAAFAEQLPQGADPIAYFHEEVAAKNKGFEVSFDASTGTLTVNGKGTLRDYFSVQWLESGYDYQLYERGIWSRRVKKLVLGEGITALDNCFSSLYDLDEVVLPQSLKIIRRSFQECGALMRLDFPDGFERIDFNSFFNKSSIYLKKVYWKGKAHKPRWMYYQFADFGEGITAAFDEKSGTLTVRGSGEIRDFRMADVPQETLLGLTYTEDKLLKRLVIEEGIIGIYNSFNHLPLLEEIHLPKGLERIERSFSEISRLTAVEFPASLQVLGNRSFNGCHDLRKVAFSGPLTLGLGGEDENFSANDLKTVVIPDGTVLRGKAFYSYVTEAILLGGPSVRIEAGFESQDGTVIFCYADQQAVLGERNTYLLKPGEVATQENYRDFPVPEEKWFEGETRSRIESLQEQQSGALRFDEKSGTLTVSGRKIQNHYARVWIYEDFYNDVIKIKIDKKIRRLVVEEGVTQIENCFNDLEALEEVRLPSTLRKINESFNHCPKLKKVKLPDSVQELYQAFSDCTALKKVDLGNGADILGGCFNRADKLKTLYIPNGSSISNGSFVCKNLGRVIIGGKKVDFPGAQEFSEVSGYDPRPFKTDRHTLVYCYADQGKAFFKEYSDQKDYILIMLPPFLSLTPHSILLLKLLAGVGLFFWIKALIRRFRKKKESKNPPAFAKCP